MTVKELRAYIENEPEDKTVDVWNRDEGTLIGIENVDVLPRGVLIEIDY